MQTQHEIYFRMMAGDKDTFRFAWRALGVAYHMYNFFKFRVRPNVGVIGNKDTEGKSMAQFEPRWESKVYGNPPNSVRDANDTVLFINANLHVGKVRETDTDFFNTRTRSNSRLD